MQMRYNIMRLPLKGFDGSWWGTYNYMKQIRRSQLELLTAFCTLKKVHMHPDQTDRIRYYHL